VSAVPAAAKPAELESAAPKRPVPEKAATLRTAAAGALAAVRRFAAKAPGPNKLPAPASAAKPVETAQSQSAALGGGEAAPPSASPKPIAPSAALPASTKRVAAPPAPGVQIGKPDPYPVDVLLALTSAVQGVPAIEAAHLAQVQLPGRAPHFLVALGTSESWEPLMQELGPRLRKFLPAGREVEMTPLTGSMFEDYFRNETQPFFKRR
jgi:hypothetical protein